MSHNHDDNNVVFPGDETQGWLTDNLLTAQDIHPDGSDLGPNHRAVAEAIGTALAPTVLLFTGVLQA
ncbi:hypothetical protein OHA40_00930 [Nocardia sp. NBC_00508]|uniref:hypothetical protein n=1 Tax=Nocardia sp. NBC_00508 TaxID=2975992 RepID=UPI002E813DB6|nr:hypothetical protein [Nocardia sp. NBC_00508]WUD66769.1 hypothetical protein OHA40_00930 [Nocardia sp. NBC_00508]